MEIEDEIELVISTFYPHILLQLNFIKRQTPLFKVWLCLILLKMGERLKGTKVLACLFMLFYVSIIKGSKLGMAMRQNSLMCIDANRRICAYPHIFAHIRAYMREYAHYPHHSTFAATARPSLIKTADKDWSQKTENIKWQLCEYPILNYVLLKSQTSWEQRS